MKIVEYEDKYIEDVRDLLVELEEYIISIDEDHLDQIGEDYREKMILYDLKEMRENDGKMYLAIDNEQAVGMILGTVTKYTNVDYLDYKCPKKGRIIELIVTNKVRTKGIGSMLVSKMEEYFTSIGCQYIALEVFGYNYNAIEFYKKHNYHTRIINMIKKLGD